MWEKGSYIVYQVWDNSEGKRETKEKGRGEEGAGGVVVVVLVVVAVVVGSR